MLAKMDGRQDEATKPRKPLVTSFRVIVFGFLGVLIFGAIVGWQVVSEGWASINFAEVIGFERPEVPVEDSQRRIASSFCLDYTNNDHNECRIWTNAVMRVHRGKSKPCLEPYYVTLILDYTDFSEIGRCLRAVGVPMPN